MSDFSSNPVMAFIKWYSRIPEPRRIKHLELLAIAAEKIGKIPRKPMENALKRIILMNKCYNTAMKYLAGKLTYNEALNIIKQTLEGI